MILTVSIFLSLAVAIVVSFVIRHIEKDELYVKKIICSIIKSLEFNPLCRKLNDKDYIPFLIEVKMYVCEQ